MKLRCLLPLVLLLSVSAAAQFPRNEVAVSAGIWDSSDLGNEPMVGASLNYHWTSLFSTRLGGFVAKGDDVTASIVYISGELHFFRDARVSPWVGAGGALARVRRDGEFGEVSDSQLTGIYSGGVDVAVTPRFALGAEVSYMNYEVQLTRFGDRVDSITYSGVGRWRW